MTISLNFTNCKLDFQFAIISFNTLSFKQINKKNILKPQNLQILYYLRQLTSTFTAGIFSGIY